MKGLPKWVVSTVSATVVVTGVVMVGIASRDGVLVEGDEISGTSAERSASRTAVSRSGEPNQWTFDAGTIEDALERREDVCRVTIEIESEGNYYRWSQSPKPYGGSFTVEDWYDWRYGEKRISQSMRPAGTSWRMTSIKQSLLAWAGDVDYQLAMLEDLRARGGPMLAFADERDRLVREADELTESVEVILRLLFGVELYRFDEGEGAEVAIEVGSRSHRTRREGEGDQVQTRSSTGELAPFHRPESSRTVQAARAADLLDESRSADIASDAGLVVWRFDPDDLAAFREILSDIDEIEQRLTFDEDEIDEEKLGRLASRGDLSGLYEYLHAFRGDFLAGVRAVARVAGVLDPAEPHGGTFEEMYGAVDSEGLVEGDIPDQLPDFDPDTTTLVLLSIPMSDLTENEVGTIDASGSPPDVSWLVPWPGVTGSAGNTVVETVVSPGTSHHRELGHRLTDVFSHVRGASSTSRVEGRFVVTAELEHEGTANGGKTEIRERGLATTTVRWSVEYGAGAVTALELRFVVLRDDGGYEPLDRLHRFGEDVYLEALYTTPPMEESITATLRWPRGDDLGPGIARLELHRTAADPKRYRSEAFAVDPTPVGIRWTDQVDAPMEEVIP